MADLNQPAIPQVLLGAPPAASNQGQGQGQAHLPLPLPPMVIPGQVQAPAAAGQGARHRSFASLYSDQNCDPLWDSAGTIMQRYDPMRADPVGAAALMASISGDPSRPGTYLCCSTVHNTPRIYLVHMLSRYPPAIDGRETPWDNHIFGYLGDLVQDQPIHVLLPDTIFEIMAPVNVYDEETLAQELPHLANGTFFSRGRVQQDNVIPITTRQLMYLPTKYAPLLISNQGYTPQEVWGRLLPQMQQDGLLVAAAPIVAWLRVTLHATAPQNTGPPATSITLKVPALNQDLSQHRTQIRILTGLGGLTPGFEASLATMANALVMQNNEARNTRMAKELERDQPTLPSAKFNMLFSSLKQMLNVAEEENLPEFWFALAAAPKKQEFSTVRDYLDKYARSPNAFLAVAPIPNPKLLTDLTSATFVADNDDDIKTGIQPFIAMDGSAAYRQATQELARSYTVLAERDVSLSYYDWDSFKIPKDLRSYPTNFYELEQNLGVFGNLIGAIIAETHPITVAYRPFWSAFTRRYRAKLHTEMDERRILKPVHLLRSIQLLCFNWFHARKEGQAAPPNFLKILEKISLSNYSIPNLPLPLYQLVNPRPPPNLKTPGLTPTDDSSVTGNSNVSGLTNPTMATGYTGLTADTRRTALTVHNTNPNANLQSLLPTNVRIKDLLGPDEAPRGTAGTPLCLSFHLRGICSSNCRRKSDHERPLSAADKDTLSNWVVDQLARRRAAGAIP